jgi:hypothetical protein
VKDPGTQDWIEYYGCDTILQRNHVERIEVSHLHEAAMARELMEGMLAKKGRTLTPIQWEHVDERVNLEPSTALYLKVQASYNILRQPALFT